ncbi:MAG TPA: hypothetical protein VJ954_02590 [Ignavibacteriaceae bacterium]|nr:hypothetical protein [Ignavibacteriaceae bacterium]
MSQYSYLRKLAGGGTSKKTGGKKHGGLKADSEKTRECRQEATRRRSQNPVNDLGLDFGTSYRKRRFREHQQRHEN